MNKTPALPPSGDAFAGLRQFVRRPGRRAERCELCGGDVFAEHPHLIEVPQRKLLCTCNACALLFSGRAETRYKCVPRRVRLLSNFQISDAEWDGLMIPISLAFFFENSLEGRVRAFYPSPAGAIESTLTLEAWSAIAEANPVLRRLAPDVEALLAHRIEHARGKSAAEYYIVPIDACYKLVGLIRMHWRGLSGGTEVWQEIGGFFSALHARADVMAEGIHA